MTNFLVEFSDKHMQLGRSYADLKKEHKEGVYENKEIEVEIHKLMKCILPQISRMVISLC